jgi:molecular chaperone GrpE
MKKHNDDLKSQSKDKKEKIDIEINSSDSEQIDNLSLESKNEKQKPSDSIEKKIVELEIQLKDYKDKLLRKAAEFENYKRRSESELSSFLKYSNEYLIVDLLPVLDDFNRLNSAWDEKHDIESFKKGIDLIYDKYKKVLQKHGVKEMESIGKKFDVNLHDALMQIPQKDVDPDTVINEIEKGYFLKDKVIRHAKVIVSSLDDSESIGNKQEKQTDND